MIHRDRVYAQLEQIALSVFSDIVESSRIVEGKLRLILCDGSFIDIWLSVKREGVYAYHWERRAIDGSVYRHNNLPDKEAKKLKTFPKHFHEKSEQVIKESYISSIPEEALRSFLSFARDLLKKQG